MDNLKLSETGSDQLLACCADRRQPPRKRAAAWAELKKRDFSPHPRATRMKNIKVEIRVPPIEAAAFARFLRRTGQTEYRKTANAGEDVRDALCAGERIRRALAEFGFTGE